MSKILGRFGGFVIKNVGDCLVYYFPESSKPKRKFGFMACMECNLSMIEYHDTLCEQLTKEGLPSVDYRISSDYGSLVLMKSSNSSTTNMIGPPLNMCFKINHSAPKNGIVIGGDLHYMVKGFTDYKFKEKKVCHWDLSICIQYMKFRGDEVIIVYQQKKEEHKEDDAEKNTSFHSEEIIENLDNVNMDPWYYIYGKYVNPNLDKKKS